jgi:cytochrome oxidase assembly protein ShyY1
VARAVTASSRARVPIGATIVVALAIAAMIALGVWQLGRRDQKLALLRLYAANQHRSTIAMPAMPDDAVLFRRAYATCLHPSAWSREAGRAADGSSGWRAVAQCAPGGGRAGFAVQMGVGGDPLHNPAWAGGPVRGYITHAPEHRALIAAALSRAAPELMLVADSPLPGLKPNPAAKLDDIPNNHLAYAVQWFLFAAIAAIIYAVALWRRFRPVAAPPARG